MYLRIVHRDCWVQVFLVAAKSRIAPIKAIIFYIIYYYILSYILSVGYSGPS